MRILRKKVDLPANPVGSNARLSIWNAAQASSQGGKARGIRRIVAKASTHEPMSKAPTLSASGAA